MAVKVRKIGPSSVDPTTQTVTDPSVRLSPYQDMVTLPNGDVVWAVVRDANTVGVHRLAALRTKTAVSRKTHGAAGPFDINLPLTGASGVECRNSGGNQMLVFSFSNNVLSGDASVTSGIGSVTGSPSFVSNTMTVNLTAVTDVQNIAVTLSNVTDDFAQVLPAISVGMTVLLGDTNGSKMVNASDISQIKSQSGVQVGEANFRQDVTVSGDINASDVSLVKSRSGTSRPEPAREASPC